MDLSAVSLSALELLNIDLMDFSSVSLSAIDFGSVDLPTMSVALDLICLLTTCPTTMLLMTVCPPFAVTNIPEIVCAWICSP